MTNPIRAAVDSGRPTFGVALTVPSPQLAETLAQAAPDGVDWLWLDTQHAGLTWDNLLPCIQATRLGGSEAVVRVGSNDDRLIMRALDLGACAVVVPLVSTAEEAARAAAACRYPPHGIRSFGPLRDFKLPAEADAGVLCIVMVENAEGLENLDAIAATPGVDGIFVGTADLALSLGCELDLAANPEPVLEAIERISAACDRHGLISGTIALNPATVEAVLERGVRFVLAGSDVGYVLQGVADAGTRVKAWSETYGH